MKEKICPLLKKNKFLILGVILLLSVTSFFVFSNTNKIPEKTKKETRAFDLKTENKQISKKLVGQIVGKNEAKLSFKEGGRVVKIYFEEGDEVKKGQLLAEVSGEEQKINDEYASKLLEKSYTNKQLTEKYYDRLIKNSKIELEQIEIDYSDGESKDNKIEQIKNSIKTYEELKRLNTNQAESSYLNSKLSKEINSISSNNNKIYAPYDGYIIARFFEEAEIVPNGIPLIHFVSTDLKIVSSISPEYASNISKKNKILLSSNQSENLEISKIYQTINESNQEIQIEVVFKSPNTEKLFINAVVNLELILEEKTLLKVAKAFVEYDFDGIYVTNSKNERIKIEPVITEDRYLFIEETDTLKSGETLLN